MLRQVVLAVLASLAMVLVMTTAASAAEPALSWSAPQAVAADPIADIDCPTTDLCIAVDAGGNVITSTDPGGEAGGWNAAKAIDTPLAGVSCASTSLCVAVSTAGNVVTSTNPTGGAAAWTTTNVGVGGNLLAVDCTVGLCAAIDANGQIITATDPTGGSAAWSVTDLQGTTSLALNTIECPSTGLCLAVGSQFHNLGGGFSVKKNVVATATNPTGGVGAWTKTFLSFNSDMSGISCPSATFCLIVDGWGSAWSSTDPTGGEAAWSEKYVDSDENMTDVSCPSSSFCAALDESAQALTSTEPTGDMVAWGVAPTAAGITRVSCPSSTLCLAAGEQQVLRGTPPVPESPQEPPAPLPGPPLVIYPASIYIQSSVLDVRGKKTHVIVTCMGPYVCSGKIKLERRVGKGARKAFRSIGSTNFSIRGRKGITITLTKAGRELLDEKKELSARIRIEAQTSAGQHVSLQQPATLKKRS